MKIRLFILVVSYCILCGCQSKQAKDATTKTAPVQASKNQITASCYQYSSGKETVRLHLNPIGDSIKGDLLYAFFEKDNSTGTIKGTMNGDTLFADYTFLSEGQVSIREVAFLKQGQNWLEGYGDVVVNEHKSTFANKAALNFDANALYKPVTCKIDAHSCLTSFDYTWSALKNKCLPLLRAGIRLNPLESSDVRQASAYIVFSEDQQQAELFLPAQEALLLTRKGQEGQHHWENGDWKLYPWKGYVLKQGDQVMYAGQ